MSRFRTRDIDDDEVVANVRADAGPSRDASPLDGIISVADWEEGCRETILTVEMANGGKMRLKVVYDPTELSNATDTRIQELSESGDNLAAARVFCDIVLEWGLMGPLTGKVAQYDDDGMIVFDDAGNPIIEKKVIVPAGEMVPLEPGIVQYLRTSVMLGIWQAIGQDASGVPTNRRERRAQRKQSRKPSPRR